MSPDAFEASETVIRTPSSSDRWAETATAPEFATLGTVVDDEFRTLDTVTPASIAGELMQRQAEDLDMRLKRCGLVWHEDQLSSVRWVAPAGFYVPANARVKVLPLFMVEPTPGLEIKATDGEIYILPKDFKGDWFAVKSPKNQPLIP